MRVNIYVPDDLRKRMRRIDKSENVNWSAVACRAFAEQCATIESRQRSVTKMKDVVERMRSLAKVEQSNVAEAGFDTGYRWGMKAATPAQLKRLAAAQDGAHRWHFGEGSSAYDAFEQFYFIIAPEDDKDRQSASEFWVTHVGEDYAKTWGPDDAEFVLEFASGALSVWHRVAHQL